LKASFLAALEPDPYSLFRIYSKLDNVSEDIINEKSFLQGTNWWHTGQDDIQMEYQV
jgi:hypothetical protein